MKRVIFLFVPLLALLILITFISTPQIEAGQLSSGQLKLNFLDQVGGRVTTVAKGGNYAYIGMGHRLVVLDVQQPTQPVVVGRSAVLSGSLYELTLHQQHAYAALDGNLAVFDIHNPLNPHFVTTYPTRGPLLNMVISGNYLYTLEDSEFINGQWQNGGMRILDISSPAAPMEVGSFDQGGSNLGYGIGIKDHYIYLGHLSDTSKTLVIDVSDPTNPTEIYSFPSDEITGIAIYNDYLYLSFRDDGLFIYDLANPQMPTFINNIDDVFATSGVSVDGSTIYINHFNTTLLFDVSNPLTPVYLDEYSDLTTAFGIRSEVTAEGDYLYVAYDTAGFQIIDVSTPTNISRIGEYDHFGEVRFLAVDDNYLYIPEYMEGISVVSVNPQGTPTTIGYYPQMTLHEAIAARDGYIYGTDLNNQAFLIIDATNPSNPVLAGQHFLEGNTNQIVLEGNYAYTVGDSLRIFDISDPQNPTILPEWPYNGGSEIVVAGSHAFIGDTNVIRIVDLSNPSAPQIIASYYMTDNVNALSIANDYLYALVEDSGLHTLDVSDLANPTAVGSLALDANFGDLFLDGPYLYMIYSNVISALDISNPALPTLISHCQTTGLYAGSDIAAKGTQLYVGQGVAGLFIMQLGSSVSLSRLDSQFAEGHTASNDRSITVDSNSGQINTYMPLVLRALPPLYSCVS